jgi:hypothetical protein
MGIQIVESDDGSTRQIDDVTGNLVGYADGTTRLVASKIATVARTDTAAKNLFKLPPFSQVLDVSVMSGAVSNAGTTATLSIGKTGSNTFFVNALDVKGATGSGKTRPTVGASSLATNLSSTADTQVVGIYAETGTASSAGGPWTVQVDYIVVNP